MAQTIPLRVNESGGTIPLSVGGGAQTVSMTSEQARVVKAVSPTIDAERVADGVEITVDDFRKQPKKVKLNDGETPVRGKDYWTEDDKAEIVSQAVEQTEADVTELKSQFQELEQHADTAEYKQSIADRVAPITVIDDTAGDSDTDKTWSADKLVDALADAGTVRDVQVGGVSVLDAQGVANVPQADGETFGVVKAGGYGVYNYIGRLRLEQPNAIQQQRGTDSTKAITPQVQHSAVFFGLAKAAGADMYSVSDVTIGQYPDEQKTAIRTMLGLDDQSIVDIVQAGLPAAEGVGF